MDKCSDHVIWNTTKEALVLHWKKLVSVLVVAVSVVVVTALCVCTSAPAGRNQPAPLCDASGSSTPDIPDSCPWHLVMSDLAHRLRLLEMAFKEQVIAREVIAAEVTNQSYTNLELERKLDEFLFAVRHLSSKLDNLKDQMSELSSRLYSDECLGFLVVVFVIVQIILAVRTKIRDKQGHGQGIKPYSSQAYNGSTLNISRSISNDSIGCVSVTPKASGSLKQDACVVTFSNCSKEQHSAQIDVLLGHVTDGIKCPVKQFHVIDSHEAMKECPRAKVYVVHIDCRGLSSDGEADQNGGSPDSFDQQDINLKVTSLRLLNLSNGVVILVMTNDPGSQQLTSHALYNTNLPLIQSYDVLQELASNGRLLTIWNEFSSYQISHIKKIGRSIFGTKGK